MRNDIITLAVDWTNAERLFGFPSDEDANGNRSSGHNYTCNVCNQVKPMTCTKSTYFGRRRVETVRLDLFDVYCTCEL